MAIFFGSICTGTPAKAQYYYNNDRYFESAVQVELGISAGIMNSLTDLGGKKGIGKNFIKDLNWKNSNFSFSVYAAGTYKYAIAARLEASFGTVEGADSVLKSVASSTAGRYERNLSFRSHITDFQLAIEVHPLFFKTYDDEEPPRISPYIVAGIGYFSFSPEAKLNGRWNPLQPLRTEGQGFAEYPDRKPYKLRQFNIPAGLGVRYEVNSFVNARFEVVHRFLTTDYLDDVSTQYIDPALFANYLPANLAAIAQQLHDRTPELNPNHDTVVDGQRGDPNDKDAFFTIHFKIGIILGRRSR
jgi:hypothetical protein